jgi:hypothetical protein
MRVLGVLTTHLRLPPKLTIQRSARAGTALWTDWNRGQNNVRMAVTTVDADRYGEQLSGKVDRVKAKFADFAIPEMEVFASPSEHYRMR